MYVCMYIAAEKFYAALWSLMNKQVFAVLQPWCIEVIGLKPNSFECKVWPTFTAAKKTGMVMTWYLNLHILDTKSHKCKQQQQQQQASKTYKKNFLPSVLLSEKRKKAVCCIV
jgi:hypothetical protein